MIFRSELRGAERLEMVFSFNSDEALPLLPSQVQRRIEHGRRNVQWVLRKVVIMIIRIKRSVGSRHLPAPNKTNQIKTKIHNQSSVNRPIFSMSHRGGKDKGNTSEPRGKTNSPRIPKRPSRILLGRLTRPAYTSRHAGDVAQGEVMHRYADNQTSRRAGR